MPQTPLKAFSAAFPCGTPSEIERGGGSFDGKGWGPPPANYEDAAEATRATAAVLGVSTALLFVVGGLYHRHLERAVRAPLPGLRSDPKWFHRDRDLTMI